MSAISDVRIVVSAALKDSLRTVTSPVRMLKVIFGAEHEPTVTEKINKAVSYTHLIIPGLGGGSDNADSSGKTDRSNEDDNAVGRASRAGSQA